MEYQFAYQYMLLLEIKILNSWRTKQKIESKVKRLHTNLKFISKEITKNDFYKYFSHAFSAFSSFDKIVSKPNKM